MTASSQTPRARLAVVSDVHLGARRVSARNIIANLDVAFSEAALAQLDFVIWAGDTFDSLLSLNHDELPLIDIFIGRFLRRCKKHDVTVLILHGTKSHDRDQPIRFLTINEVADIRANVHYFDKLSIWHEERFNLNFLFVPDEWHHDTQETLRQVHELLDAKKLHQVDFSIMHGNFKHHLPEVAKAPKHDEESYLRITKYFVFIGHNHRNVEYDRIRTPGSFARLSHGEEEPKGHYLCDLYENGTAETTFVENTGALKFTTIDCLGMDANQTLERAMMAASTLSDGDYLRLLLDRENPYARNLGPLVTAYPLINWTVEEKGIEKSALINALKRDVDYTPIYITPENIVELVRERLGSKDYPEEIQSRMLNQLTQIVADHS